MSVADPDVVVSALEAPRSAAAVQGCGVVSEEHTVGASSDDLELVAFLASLPSDDLVELLVEAAERDDILRNRLLLERARRSRGFDPALCRKALSRAFSRVRRGRGGARYSSREWATGVHAVIDELKVALGPASAPGVIKVCESGLKMSDRKKDQIDDSSGWFQDIDDRLGALHHDACLLALPDPVKLARRLFAWETEGEWDTFSQAAVSYRDVLGDAGVGEYRRLATAAWEQLPALGPGDDSNAQWSGSRWRTTRVMEALAEIDGDVDALIDAKAHDLSSPWRFVEIAALCREHDRGDDALYWAERGIAAFGVGADARLDEVAATELEAHGRAGDAVAIAWARFERAPSLTTYRFLMERAVRAGVGERWRAQALEHLVCALDGETPPPPAGPARRRLEAVRSYQPDARSVLVEVRLWEGDIDNAWTVASEGGGVPHRLWMRLADAREVEHPSDVIPVYEREVELLAALKTKDAYASAVEVIGHLGQLADPAGCPDRFRDYVARLRVSHKAKRNFMALLDEAGW